MLNADFEMSTGIFAIHDAHVQSLTEGTDHSRADTLVMLKILCNTLGVNFEHMYNIAVGVAKTATSSVSGSLAHELASTEKYIASGQEKGQLMRTAFARADAVGFSVVNINKDITTDLS